MYGEGKEECDKRATREMVVLELLSQVLSSVLRTREQSNTDMVKTTEASTFYLQRIAVPLHKQGQHTFRANRMLRSSQSALKLRIVLNKQEHAGVLHSPETRTELEIPPYPSRTNDGGVFFLVRD